jgi:hypothetical protein
MAGHRRRTSAPNTGPCQLRTSNWLVKSQDSRAQSTNRPACHPAAGRSEPPERHNKVGHPSVLARCFHKRCTRTNLSVTLASCEQGIEEYLQGTSPALLAAYEEVVRDVVTTAAVGLADAGARERTRMRCSCSSRQRRLADARRSTRLWVQLAGSWRCHGWLRQGL